MAQPCSFGDSSSSSSVAPPLPGHCLFQWDAAAGQWVQKKSNCSTGTTCPTPADVLTLEGMGTVDGQAVYPACVRSGKSPMPDDSGE
jgi:hypothetical protein